MPPLAGTRARLHRARRDEATQAAAHVGSCAGTNQPRAVSSKVPYTGGGVCAIRNRGTGQLALRDHRPGEPRGKGGRVHKELPVAGAARPLRIGARHHVRGPCFLL